jgi:hypothetical protein
MTDTGSVATGMEDQAASSEERDGENLSGIVHRFTKGEVSLGKVLVGAVIAARPDKFVDAYDEAQLDETPELRWKMILLAAALARCAVSYQWRFRSRTLTEADAEVLLARVLRDRHRELVDPDLARALVSAACGLSVLNMPINTRSHATTYWVVAALAVEDSIIRISTQAWQARYSGLMRKLRRQVGTMEMPTTGPI